MANLEVNDKNSNHDRVTACWIKTNDFSSQLLKSEKLDNGYFIPGNKDELVNQILSIINNSKQLITLSTYILDDKRIEDALIKAIEERKVDVYIITSHFKFLEEDYNKEQIIDDDVEDEKNWKTHELTLINLAGKAMVRFARHIHSKFILSDPRSPDIVKGLLLTSNLRKKELNENRDIALLVNGKEVLDIFNQFCLGFWNECDNEISPEEIKIRPAIENNNINIPNIKEPSRIYITSKNQSNLGKKVLSLINETSGDITVCSYGYDLNNNIVQALINEKKKGRSVKVFARPRKHAHTRKALIKMRKNGIVVYGLQELHAKAILIEDKNNKKGIIMTSNFSNQGLEYGFETGIYVEGQRATTLSIILKEWEKIAEYKLELNKDINELESSTLVWLDEKIVNIDKIR